MCHIHRVSFSQVNFEPEKSISKQYMQTNLLLNSMCRFRVPAANERGFGRTLMMICVYCSSGDR
jgi:hypothetical protein